MQIEVVMDEPLVPGPSHLEVVIAIIKLRKYKSPVSDQQGPDFDDVKICKKCSIK
jgi:hypothetical protein